SPVDLVITAADSLLRHEEFARTHRPDVILRLGAPWASRVVTSWLNEADCDQVLVDPFWSWVDPGRVVGTLEVCDPNDLAREVIGLGRSGDPRTPDVTDWAVGWSDAEARAQAAIDGVLDGCDRLTEPGVARYLMGHLDPESLLVVSSSMPIRDVEWFGRGARTTGRGTQVSAAEGGAQVRAVGGGAQVEPPGRARVLANRGVNGIDGMVSMAMGVARADVGPTVGLLGDLAFLHDAGALCGWRAPAPVLVVIDNGGGGIFSFLDYAADVEPDQFELLFATPMPADPLAVAHGYGVTTAEAETRAQLAQALAFLGADPRGGVIRCRTDREANVELHRRLELAVAGVLG
ncbi:MAG: hypothetical protein ACRD0E_09790, partial [Acidimicrobiales bacterium]